MWARDGRPGQLTATTKLPGHFQDSSKHHQTIPTTKACARHASLASVHPLESAAAAALRTGYDAHRYMAAVASVNSPFLARVWDCELQARPALEGRRNSLEGRRVEDVSVRGGWAGRRGGQGEVVGCAAARRRSFSRGSHVSHVSREKNKIPPNARDRGPGTKGAPGTKQKGPGCRLTSGDTVIRASTLFFSSPSKGGPLGHGCSTTHHR